MNKTLLAISLILVLAIGCITVRSNDVTTANQAPTAYIDSISPTEVAPGDEVTFKGYGTDPDGNVVSYSWRSSLTGELSDKARFETSSLSQGKHYIYLKVRDNNGVWSQEVRHIVMVASKADNVAFSIQAPLPGERFIKNESITFKASLPGIPAVSGSNLLWHSSIDGKLGSGRQIKSSKLSTGSHQIEVSAPGYETSVTIYIYNDLWALYQSPPSQAEIDRIMHDFVLNWIDGEVSDEKWKSYEAFKFHQKSSDPSKLIAISKLDLLRHQQFSQPLPFSKGKTAYEHLKSHVNTINLKLDCSYNTGGGGTLNLKRNFSVWDSRKSGTQDNPNACKTPFYSPPILNKYINSLYLLLHEGRHCESNDPGHVSCMGKSNMDQTLENGSGHAQAALYLMWIYKYGLYDPTDVKEEAKGVAKGILESRFCSPPTHTNPKVQAILNELK
jgi:hypothetical protein